MTAIDNLRVSGQIYHLRTTAKGGKIAKLPSKSRLSALHHILANHYDDVTVFLSTEFKAPFAQIVEYGKLYSDVPAHMYFYAQLADPEATATYLPPNDHRIQNELEGVNAAITLAWRLTQEIADSLVKAQGKVKDLLESLKFSAEWTDEVLYAETKEYGDSWSSDLLSDVFACLDELRESYTPIIDYFNLQEVHLRLMQERIFDDANSKLDSLHANMTIRGLSFPLPPVMPYPWAGVRRRGIRFVMMWRAFSESELFTNLDNACRQLADGMRSVSKLDSERRPRRVSDKVRGALHRVKSSLLISSEINAY
ncbi:hypothetical protein NP233_g5294 [Leucocoprinus birnbaumii]|uniref:Uncharacterized protein n=1 Tax=Leucocoprinus birnbaumii TaxID=56174 RepID=A0AAD5VUJ3_9AGAR|nr:hypothetical protein NP233_g5294 [Leucocoprinus birnbaumii]